jgi:NADH-quinone oxidoreductase subunit C
MEQTQALLHTVHDRLKTKFGEAIVSAEMHYDFPVFVIKKDRILEVIDFLKGDEEMGFQFLTTLCGLHFPDADASMQFGMMYQLHNMRKNHRIRLKVYTTANDMEFPTLTKLFATANWMEREAYDFFGFTFKGHPDLRRVLNVEDMNYFPLRKEYPLEDATREDKNDKMFGR